MAVSPSTSSCLLAPSLGLAACVRGYMGRSTLGAELQPAQRLNYFPASPLCSISCISQGESWFFRPGEPANQARPVPPLAFLGPQTGPTASRNPGPGQGFMLLLLPDALQALTGVDMAAHVDRFSPLEQVLDADWCRMAQAVQQAPDDANRVQLIEAFLLPRWQALRRQGTVPGHRVQDWAQVLALRAMTSGVGQSLRQAERRIKAWTGQSLRQLQQRGRSEMAFFQVRDAMQAGAVDWAGLAVEAGYADQSHFCRETRRVSGFSPEVLRRCIEEEESFWVYRIWS